MENYIVIDPKTRFGKVFTNSGMTKAEIIHNFPELNEAIINAC